MINWPVLLGLAAAFGLGRFWRFWSRMEPSKSVLTTPNWQELVANLERIETLIAESQLGLTADQTIDPLNHAHRIVGECIKLLRYRPMLDTLLDEVDPLGDRMRS